MNRSEIMRSIRATDTTPEMIVRRMAHALGFRFRLHRSDLPGKPDLCFPGRRKIIFIHGCFWHGHHCKRGARIPRSNRDYWVSKIDRNRRRDRRSARRLRNEGWSVLTVWECETRDAERLKVRLVAFLCS